MFAELKHILPLFLTILALTDARINSRQLRSQVSTYSANGFFVRRRPAILMDGMPYAIGVMTANSPLPVIYSVDENVTASNCFAFTGEPGCNDPECERAVCACDSYCCTEIWDDYCARGNPFTVGCSAPELCLIEGGLIPNTTIPEVIPVPIPEVLPEPEIEMDDEIVAIFQPVQNATIEVMPEVKPSDNETLSDETKVPSVPTTVPPMLPIENGTIITDIGSDCFDVQDSPGCDDAECEAAVCACDSYCCDVVWDASCSKKNSFVPGCAAADLCGPEGGNFTGVEPEEPVSDCFTSKNTPGCDNVICESLVCKCDPYCCTMIWDDACSTKNAFVAGCSAADICTDIDFNNVTAVFEDDCLDPTDTPGCSNKECESKVCACDPYCCEAVWDSSCATMNSFNPGCSALSLC